MSLPTLEALRYVLPLREGGSLPAIVDTAAGPYAVKFRGAGQGPKALVAEVITWGLARALSLPVPDAALVSLGEGFGAAEPNPEIQDLLRASVGLNFGLRYLSGALGFDPVADRVGHSNSVLRALGRMRNELEYRPIEEVLAELPAHMQSVQSVTREASEAIRGRFFPTQAEPSWIGETS